MTATGAAIGACTRRQEPTIICVLMASWIRDWTRVEIAAEQSAPNPSQKVLAQLFAATDSEDEMAAM